MAGRKPTKKSKDHKFDYGIAYTDYLVDGSRPSKLTFDNLRNLARANPFVAVAKNIIKQRVSKTTWVIKPLDEVQDQTTIDELKPRIATIKKLLVRPNIDSNEDTFRKLVNVTLDDILDIDQGAVEKVKNLKGEILALYHIDGATLQPQIDQSGLFRTPAYLQYIDSNVIANPGGNPDAEFEVDDVLWFQANPFGRNGLTGYGQSPVELVVSTIMGGIQALLYNVSYFSENNVPPAIVNLAKANPAAVKQFANDFKAQLQGKNWAVAFTNGENLDVKSLRPNNMEMEFYKLNRWLAQVVISAFGLSPKDFGITEDTNRATALVQDRGTTKSIASYLDVLAEEINTDLIGDFAKVDPMYELIEFAWDAEDKMDALTQAQIDQINVSMGLRTPNEIRIRDGLAPIEEEETQNSKEQVAQESSDKTLAGDSPVFKSRSNRFNEL